MKARQKKTRDQLDLGLTGDTQTRPERTLEVNCTNCGAKFVAYYRFDEENVDTVEVNSCGLCHGEDSHALTSRARALGSWLRSRRGGEKGWTSGHETHRNSHGRTA